MEKVLIVGCKRAMNDICIACSRCSVGFNRKDGEFARYQENEAELIGILNCGDCPGGAVVSRLIQLKLWNAPLDELPTKIHIAPCILSGCPYKDQMLESIRNKAGIEVIEGTHPYKPAVVFGE
ncbi:MAG: CGGC domain-containing protein [Candidatus Omnitrophica bacterium]|nr:CGGC domain-containing protein [Candidatus Omnitrophota bacterium]